MNKTEAIAYLRKKVLLERLSLTTDTNPEAAEELDAMEKLSEDETQPSESVPNH